MAAGIRQSKVDWILHCAVQDIGFKTALKDLNEQEIRHCLGLEKRKSAIEALRREARRKRINMEEPAGVKCPSCGWSGPAKDWKAIVCPRCGKWIKIEQDQSA
ncbi:MAG: hypothetical protein AB9873_17790 [Syntrophobacteraceae bacterium]